MSKKLFWPQGMDNSVKCELRNVKNEHCVN